MFKAFFNFRKLTPPQLHRFITKSVVQLAYLALFAVFSNAANAQCPTAPGDQTTYGDDVWIGYVYTGLTSGANAFTTTYRGYVTQAAIFNSNIGSAPITGANLCGSYSNQFAIRYKMSKYFAAGNYTIVVGGDDGYRLSVDGGTTWAINNWTDHSYATTTQTLSLSGLTNLVLEYYEQGGDSQVSFAYGLCSGGLSTMPTTVSGTNPICAGNAVTLTASGGTEAIGALYQWGSNGVGNNIIEGATGASITVTPSATTTYWVRRIDTACVNTTGANTYQIIVRTPSTAPTAIANAGPICIGNSITLTASGGIASPGSIFEWGTGSVAGSNIIAGQNFAAITVSPTTSTTYWVRRIDNATCQTTSEATTTMVTVAIPAGNQTDFGLNSWIGYLYANIGTGNPPANAFTSAYNGYITQPETFDQNIGTGSLSGPNLCTTYAERFAIRYKMQKNFTAGYYNFTIGGDDGVRLSLDGGATFPYGSFVDQSYTTYTSGAIFLSGLTYLVLEYYEQSGSSQVSFSYTACTDYSAPPVDVTGIKSICSGQSTSLAATGGYNAPGATYQWGTGTTIGSNIISGQTSSAINVSPTANTTYWVRKFDPTCNVYTAGISSLVTVTPLSTAPTSITGNSNICEGASTTLTANGGTSATGSVFQWGTGYTVGLNTIAGDTQSITVNPSVSTVYWVRRVNGSPCNSQTGGVTLLVNVRSLSTAPTAISGNTCAGSGGTTLTATGGVLGTNGTYQWGTGTTVGSNVVSSNTTYASLYVNPTIETVYWVRRVDSAPCSISTAGIFITVAKASTAPTSISGTATICNGSTTVLRANGGTSGTNAVFEWGTGNSIGNNIIAGQSAVTISVSPTTTTTYWVRRVDPLPCNSATSGTTYTVNVNVDGIAPTSISGNLTLCSGTGGTVLTANGGNLGTNGTYQWGTGSVIGSNVIAGTNSSLNVNPTSTTTYWVRIANGTPCTTFTGGTTTTVTVSNASTAPTSISGTAAICLGANTILTATGGTLAAGGTYQWGTGWTVGSNIIAGSGVSITVSPTASTVYWVRRLDAAPCNTQTNGVTREVVVTTRSTAPTAISGTSPMCFNNGSTPLTAIGGALGSNGLYQWGTGATIGANIIGGQTSNVIYVNPAATTTYWVRIADSGACNSQTAGVTFTMNVMSNATNPTAITGTNTICSGNSTTLTASGGVLGAGSNYQWGTGSTIGSNIITGTGASITVNPTASTTYWVRIINGSPCQIYTWGPTYNVTVTPTSTAPTSISASGSVSCPGNAITLTAVGGTAAAGATYQWGTGNTVGSNIIAGTGISINISPTANTTYWVRRRDNGTCTAFTSGTTTTVAISSTSGNPAVFGNNQWNVYGYSTGDITLATAIYSGFYTQSTLGFDTAASWNNTASPSSATNWSGCTIPADNFTFVHKRKGFPCGTYNLTMNNWDDATQVYINGVLAWSCADWNGALTCSGIIGTFNLDANSEIEVRTIENFGMASARLDLINTNITSTTPTAIAGIGAICSGTLTTLTATGGILGTTGVYQWGTGSTVGQNIITGATTASITVSPTSITSYWVRRVDVLCNYTTGGIVQAMTIAPATVAGTLATPVTTICKNTQPRDITLSGNVGSVLRWQSANNAAFTSDVVDINVTSTTLTGAQIGVVSDSRFFRAVVQSGSCAIQNTQPISIVVPNTVTYNGTWNGIPTDTTPVVINSDYTLTNDLDVCSCKVAGNAIITVPSGVTLTVQGEVFVTPNAQIIIENNGSLVQVDDSSANIGSIIMKRSTAPMKQFDYTYWSSPVQNFTLQQLSPNTLSDKYFSYSAITNGWVTHPFGNQIMEAAKGYIVRAPQGWTQSNATLGVYNAVFTGVPNTGVIPVTIQKGTGAFNLIGNPYPSAINIDLFLLNPANAGITNGTIYLWSHNTGISNSIPGNSVYNYTRDDYAKYNITGGVKTASASITGGTVPTGKIASGQAFFIEANTALANGNYTATFRNSMRIANNNDQFFRMASDTVVSNTGIEKHRVWLNISNTAGAYDEMLLGYIQGATNEMDNLYDGKTFPAGNVVGLYSLLGDIKLSIQGRALPFNNEEIIPLGFNTTIAGTFAIQLEDFDGLFDNQNVYLYDKSNDTYHNLKESPYSFSAEIGTSNTRFELRFIDGTLGINNPTIEQNEVLVIKKDKNIAIDAGNYTMERVSIFDMTGKQIYQSGKINAPTFNTGDLNFADQVLVVKINFDNQETISRKVIMN